MQDIIANNVSQYRRLAPRFERMFQTKLKPYFDFVTGFKVIEFDDDVVHSVNGESMAEAVERQWGTDGVDLIKELIQ